MRFDLVDAVLEESEDRIVTLKQVTAAEEYLADHFPGYPILPGVFMLESMVQAARRLLDRPDGPRLVADDIRNVKYGAMVRPGDRLIVTVTSKPKDGAWACKGSCVVERPGSSDRSVSPGDETAASGRFTMRAARLATAAPATRTSGMN